MNRILFLVSSMEGGGAERVAALLCNHWAAQGHDVTLMPTFSGRGECLYSLDDRVQLDYLADRVGSRSRSALNKLRRYGALRRAIRETAPDIIVSFLPHVNVAAVLAAWGLRIPVVVSERVHPPTMPLGRGLEALRRLTYARARHVIVQTEYTLGWLQDCCPQARGRVIPNPVVYPLPAAAPRQGPDSVVDETRCVVLAVGRLDEQKGFDQLLAAFAALAPRFPEWDLVILGEGAERERLESQCDGLGLAGRVHLPGRAGNPGDWYQRADLYVMSSRFEGFPNTLAEAMAHGLPAVSFDCETGPREIVRHEEDGLLVPRDDPEALAAALDRMMADATLRAQFSERAVEVRERFSVHRVARQWEEFLGSV
jgi:glycosyltransferase involved in cell wall biosynthesis